MAWTQADVDKMKRAIASGARVVQLNGERVEYRSLAEMRATLAMMQGDLDCARKGAFSVSYPRMTRGL